MRYPADKIKEAILHPDIEIRARATRYFAKSFSSDFSIMPLVIKAVETYGRQNDAYRLIGLSRDLPQSEDTISWVIDELDDPQSDQYENYTYNLSMILLKADPAVLLSRESGILEARHFPAALHSAITERLQMLSWDFATCWEKLEEFCEEGKEKQNTSEINLGYAYRIVEALARYGEECEEKVCQLLAVKIDDYSHDPMKWLEPLAVRLAGEALLESATPLLVAKLHEDGDLLGSACQRALSNIGTSAVLEAVAEAYPKAPYHFRLYGTGPLEYIHTDLAVEKCLLLLADETDHGLKCHLAHSLLSQFAPEGIEVARQLLVGQELDFDEKGLRNHLLETCTLTGERFAEYDEWMATEKVEKQEHWRKIKELEGDPNGLLLFALEKLTGKKAVDMPKAEPILPAVSRMALPHTSKQKVGRNDPCPCRSGKKFKHCCMNKQRQF